MDFSNYDEEIRTLAGEITHHIQDPGDRILRLLNRLDKYARAAGDHALSGYAAFYYARVYYYREEHNLFFQFLKRALRHLLRSPERETTARAYNLFAVEAQRLGCLDVAYHYFRTAYSFVGDTRDSLARAVIDANMGDLLTEMGDYRKACTHIRRSIPVIRRNRDDGMHRHALLLETINLGLHSLYAGDSASAKRVLETLRRHSFPEKHEDGTDTYEALWYLLFLAMLALDSGELLKTKRLTELVIERIVKKPVFGGYMKDVYRFCRMLITSGEHALAGKLIRACDKNTCADIPAYICQLFAQLKIDYYRAAGNRKKLAESYAERHRLFRLQLDDQQRIHHESVRLMRLADDLHAEQTRLRRENRLLRIAAETDALCELPNRYALNRALEEAFDRALSAQHNLGIGVADIDAFKQYNDTYGHKTGDACLCSVADTLRTLSRRHGLFVARYGGDEFVLIYENMSNAEIRRVEQELRDEAPVSVSHGFFNAIPTGETKMWTFLSNADKRLYNRKRNASPS